MQKTSTIAIPTSDANTLKGIFDKVQFPIRYNFPQNPSTCVVQRDFGGAVGQVRKVKVQLEGTNYLYFAEVQVLIMPTIMWR